MKLRSVNIEEQTWCSRSRLISGIINKMIPQVHNNVSDVNEI